MPNLREERMLDYKKVKFIDTSLINFLPPPPSKIFANTVKQKKINTLKKKSKVFFLSALAVSVLKKVSDMLTLGFTC